MEPRRFLITGGAGFIGSNLANRLLEQGEDVVLIDNLSRPGSGKNLAWLRYRHGRRVVHHVVDIRRFDILPPIFADREVIVHTGGQVAVTHSVLDPRTDFEINAMGTLNCLEAARLSGQNPIFLLTSTNKVYGGLESVPIVEEKTRWAYQNHPHGIGASQPLDFHSPYGCSKGAADQYTRDYARIYNLRSVVFRMSCQCGQRQFGTEDQGWVAHFVFSALTGREITLYGDGKQVRDILDVDDLLNAMLAAVDQINKTAGQVYNIGGGPDHSLSLLETIRLLGERLAKPIRSRFEPARPGDQVVYISDIRQALQDFGWSPRVSREETIDRLIEWCKQVHLG